MMIRLMLGLILLIPALGLGAGTYQEITFEGSTEEGELQLGVTFTLWIPDSAEPLRGVIVHQHGCGVGASKGGTTAAYDLHWQALAQKWNCALLGPSYHQEEGTDCRLWCDPRNGSSERFVEALEALAKQAKRPEIADVPWCLWGHSGGGFWASLMQMIYPERIAAIWFQSGQAHSRWTSGEIEKPEIPAAALEIPMISCPGVEEKGHERFKVAWNGSLAMVKDYRAQGAPIAFAPDPQTGHECGDSRYLAIPFFDACLAMRLPDAGAATQTLKPVSNEQAWLSPILGKEAFAAATYRGAPADTNWFPNEAVALAWEEFVKTGTVEDETPPKAPYNVKAKRLEDGTIEITWDAKIDFESGIGGFVILRDQEEIGNLPESPNGRFGRPLFQEMSYHDTPEAPLPEMRFIDKKAGDEYQVVTVNSAGLQSAPSKPAMVE